MSPNPTQKPVKVLAYVTRLNKGLPELLVFRHRDYPLAGIQVPAGTVEPSESLDDAAIREVEEESGLTGLTAPKEVASEDYFHKEKGQMQERHFFQMELIDPDGIQDHWEFTVLSSSSDSGLVFMYYWLPIAQADTLAGGQGKHVPAIMALK